MQGRLVIFANEDFTSETMSTNLDELSSDQLWAESVEDGGEGALEDFMLTGNYVEGDMNENGAKIFQRKSC